MTDTTAPSADTPIGTTSLGLSAGAMLRQARETRGLHIAALATSIKVSPRKLEALEADRYADLPDITFARALAQAVCRALKIDAEPVLARLPQAGDASKLARVGGRLNTPYREPPGRSEPSHWLLLRRPVFWATFAVLLAAIALALLPDSLIGLRDAASKAAAVARPASAAASAPAASAASAPATSAASAAAPASVAPLSIGSAAALPAGAASTVIETVFDAPRSDAAATPAAGAGPAGVLVVRTSAESWVEVQDAAGQNLLSRTVQPGEAVGLDGALPLRVKVGNAAATQLSFRGRPVDLATLTRDNVARLELK